MADSTLLDDMSAPNPRFLFRRYDSVSASSGSRRSSLSSLGSQGSQMTSPRCQLNLSNCKRGSPISSTDTSSSSVKTCSGRERPNGITQSISEGLDEDSCLFCNSLINERQYYLWKSDYTKSSLCSRCSGDNTAMRYITYWGTPAYEHGSWRKRFADGRGADIDLTPLIEVLHKIDRIDTSICSTQCTMCNKGEGQTIHNSMYGEECQNSVKNSEALSERKRRREKNRKYLVENSEKQQTENVCDIQEQLTDPNVYNQQSNNEGHKKSKLQQTFRANEVNHKVEEVNFIEPLPAEQILPSINGELIFGDNLGSTRTNLNAESIILYCRKRRASNYKDFLAGLEPVNRMKRRSTAKSDLHEYSISNVNEKKSTEKSLHYPGNEDTTSDETRNEINKTQPSRKKQGNESVRKPGCRRNQRNGTRNETSLTNKSTANMVLSDEQNRTLDSGKDRVLHYKRKDMDKSIDQVLKYKRKKGALDKKALSQLSNDNKDLNFICKQQNSSNTEHVLLKDNKEEDANANNTTEPSNQRPDEETNSDLSSIDTPKFNQRRRASKVRRTSRISLLPPEHTDRDDSDENLEHTFAEIRKRFEQRHRRDESESKNPTEDTSKPSKGHYRLQYIKTVQQREASAAESKEIPSVKLVFEDIRTILNQENGGNRLGVRCESKTNSEQRETTDQNSDGSEVEFGSAVLFTIDSENSSSRSSDSNFSERSEKSDDFLHGKDKDAMEENIIEKLSSTLVSRTASNKMSTITNKKDNLVKETKELGQSPTKFESSSINDRFISRNNDSKYEDDDDDDDDGTRNNTKVDKIDDDESNKEYTSSDEKESNGHNGTYENISLETAKSSTYRLQTQLNNTAEDGKFKIKLKNSPDALSSSDNDNNIVKFQHKDSLRVKRLLKKAAGSHSGQAYTPSRRSDKTVNRHSENIVEDKDSPSIERIKRKLGRIEDRADESQEEINEPIVLDGSDEEEMELGWRTRGYKPDFYMSRQSVTGSEIIDRYRRAVSSRRSRNKARTALRKSATFTNAQSVFSETDENDRKCASAPLTRSGTRQQLFDNSRRGYRENLNELKNRGIDANELRTALDRAEHCSERMTEKVQSQLEKRPEDFSD